MKTIFLLLSVFLGVQAFGQEKDSIYNSPDVMPEFVGGEQGLLLYIRKTVVYPLVDLQNDKEGIAYVRFVITEEGEITNVRIYEGAEGKCTALMAAEGIRAIKAMPKWIPGLVNGIPVKVNFSIPIRFTLGGKKSKNKGGLKEKRKKRKAKKSKD